MNPGRPLQHSLRPQIWIVDDDPDLLAALRFALEIDGYAVRAFDTGEALLAAAHASELACLVIDQGLPGATGLDVLDQLRQRGMRQPAILITTHPGALLRRRAAHLDAAIVEKPLLGDALTQAIRDRIGPGAA